MLTWHKHPTIPQGILHNLQRSRSSVGSWRCMPCRFPFVLIWYLLICAFKSFLASQVMFAKTHFLFLFDKRIALGFVWFRQKLATSVAPTALAHRKLTHPGWPICAAGLDAEGFKVENNADAEWHLLADKRSKSGYSFRGGASINVHWLAIPI